MELKSTFPDSSHNYSNQFNFKTVEHQHGFICELYVIKSLMLKGFKLKSHRLKTPFGEADLIFNDHHKIVFVEVKSYSASDFSIEKRVSMNQVRRLRNISQYLGDKYHIPIEAWIVFVNYKNNLKWFGLEDFEK